MGKNLTDPLVSYGRLEEAATFFLNSAFGHANSAAHLEIAGIIFAERIATIDPEPDWVVPTLPKTLPEILHALFENNVEVISEATASKLRKAWIGAQTEASDSGRKLSKTHRIEAMEIVGHVINLAACVETVINRHLFLQRESGKLENHLFSSLDRTEVIPKILFALKDEVQTHRLPTSRLVHLIRLRNQAVHFKASSAEPIGPTVEELLGIWKDVGQLLELVKGSPTRQDLNRLVKLVQAKWFA
ncbi:MAG TPA: hypothetical protein VJ180_16285 [Pyrinomonadaceae bacterium]|nr:hypothetical protein [Pyrinomonadaceae bacterium]